MRGNDPTGARPGGGGIAGPRGGRKWEGGRADRHDGHRPPRLALRVPAELTTSLRPPSSSPRGAPGAAGAAPVKGMGHSLVLLGAEDGGQILRHLPPPARRTARRQSRTSQTPRRKHFYGVGRADTALCACAGRRRALIGGAAQIRFFCLPPHHPEGPVRATRCFYCACAGGAESVRRGVGDSWSPSS